MLISDFFAHSVYFQSAQVLQHLVYLEMLNLYLLIRLVMLLETDDIVVQIIKLNSKQVESWSHIGYQLLINQNELNSLVIHSVFKVRSGPEGMIQNVSRLHLYFLSCNQGSELFLYFLSCNQGSKVGSRYLLRITRCIPTLPLLPIF